MSKRNLLIQVERYIMELEIKNNILFITNLDIKTMGITKKILIQILEEYIKISDDCILIHDIDYDYYKLDTENKLIFINNYDYSDYEKTFRYLCCDFNNKYIIFAEKLKPEIRNSYYNCSLVEMNPYHFVLK